MKWDGRSALTGLDGLAEVGKDEATDWDGRSGLK